MKIENHNVKTTAPARDFDVLDQEQLTAVSGGSRKGERLAKDLGMDYNWFTGYMFDAMAK